MTETDGPKSDTFPVKFRNENTNCTFGVKLFLKLNKKWLISLCARVLIPQDSWIRTKQIEH